MQIRDVVLCVGHRQVLRAKHSHTGLERLLVHLEGFWKLPLSTQDTSDVVLGAGHKRVVAAKHFFTGLEALVVHLERLWVLALTFEYDPNVVLGCGCVWVEMPDSLKTLPEHIPIMFKCLIMPAVLKARSSKLARCCNVNLAPTRPSFSYSCFRQRHAERANKSLFACRALIAGDRSVSARLHHARHMDVTCCAPARAPSQQFPAGFQAHPADWEVCAHAIGPRLRALGAREIACTRVGKATASLLGLAARRRGSTLALVLLPVPRLTGSGAVARFLAAAAQMRRGLAATARAARHRPIRPAKNALFRISANC